MVKKEVIIEVNSADDGDIPIWSPPKDLFPPILAKGELVRCKDCAWRYFSRANGEHYCFEFNAPVTDTDFCSKAERKEE